MKLQDRMRLIVASVFFVVLMTLNLGCVNRAAHQVAVDLQSQLGQLRRVSKPTSDKPANVAIYEDGWTKAEAAAAKLASVTE